jgi:hypothetical protein
LNFFTAGPISWSFVVSDLARKEGIERGTYFDDTSALVPDDHILARLVRVGATEARVGNLDQDLIVLDIFSCGRLNDLALLRALEYCELNHCCSGEL